MKTVNNKSKICIVTPVKNDVRIFGLIDSFRKIKFNNRFEFLIVCNGSKKTFIKRILKCTKDFNNLKLYSLKKANLTNAINFGVKKSSVSKIVVIDSDCLVDKEFFKPMHKALTNNPVVRGKVRFKGVNPFSKLSAKLRTYVYKKEDALFFMPNLGFRKEVFKRVGYFKKMSNNDGRTADSEWGYRANKLDIKLVREEGAIITHYCYTNPLTEIWVSVGYGRGRAYCCRQELLGKKSFKNLINAMSIPFVFNKEESVIYNLFAAFYAIVWNYGFIKETIQKRLP